MQVAATSVLCAERSFAEEGNVLEMQVGIHLAVSWARELLNVLRKGWRSSM